MLTFSLTALSWPGTVAESILQCAQQQRLVMYAYAIVGGAISIRDPYICADESHAVFHRPVVCAVKT